MCAQPRNSLIPINFSGNVDSSRTLIGGWSSTCKYISNPNSKISSFIDYHWDDRQKLRRDYSQLLALYDSLLPILAIKLNELHRKTYTERFWEIIVGQWLLTFINVAFDRWSMIDDAIGNHSITEVLLDINPKTMSASNSTAAFHSDSISDEWNSLLLLDIALCRNLDVRVNHVEKPAISTPNPVRELLTRPLRRFVVTLSRSLQRKNSVLISHGYMPLKIYLKMMIHLKQIPFFYFEEKLHSYPMQDNLRNWKLESGHEGIFENFLVHAIPKYIPRSIIEGHIEIDEKSRKLPTKPKAIVSFVEHYCGDMFKFWTAQNTEMGTQFFVVQHGGHFDAGAWDLSQDMDYRICDRWFGWGKRKRPKPYVGAFNTKLSGSKNLKRGAMPEGDLLIELGSVPKWFYTNMSMPLSGQWDRHDAINLKMVAHLPVCIRNRTVVRLFPQNFGRLQIERWLGVLPSEQVNDGSGSIWSLRRKARLVVSTYNATTYLETFAAKIPTLLFWDPTLWEIGDAASGYYEQLKEVGILHFSEESLVTKISEVWQDTFAWWDSIQVKDARAQFCHEFTCISERPDKDLTDLIRLSKIEGHE